MAKQTINIGTSANSGNGDPLRSAFNKINQNFTELYEGDGSNTELDYLTLMQRAFIVQDVVFNTVVSFTKEDNATGEETIDDIIPGVLALTRGSIRGLFNPYLEDAYDNNTHESPLGTLWNADGWSGDEGSQIANYRSRTYVTLRQALNNAIGENIIGAELIMWDIVNNNYYKFQFSEWSQQNGGGFAYDRQLIVDPNNFTKTDGGSQIDIIKANNPSGSGIGITRGNAQGIYNTYQDEGWSSNVSPSGTVWNVDGWSDLTNITTRTYTTFYNAFDQSIGRNILDKECVMYVEDTDTYYAIKFNRWTQGVNGQQQGGGFSYSRYVIDMEQLQEGITFADGTVQKTAYVPPTNTRVKSTASNDRRIEEVTGNKSVIVTERILRNLTTTASRNSDDLARIWIDRTATTIDEILSNTNAAGIIDNTTIEFSLDNTTWYTWSTGTWSDGDERGYGVNLDGGDLTYSEGDTVYFRYVGGGAPMIWWDKNDLPGGSNDFRGAIIDYHAFTGEATIIGTIHIVDDDGEEHITHTEVSSGDTDSENDDLWLVQNEGTISYRRIDLESRTLRIHWMAKVFYGDQYYND
jgi:hypothetical protein